jgi:diguanylate cyclase (GGDEF)-like protein/PAS domain S-box-containing protein
LDLAALGKLGLGRIRGIAGGARPSADEAVDRASPKELREALLLLRDYEQSGRGWFWSTDSEGRIDYVSECVAQKLGKSCAELTGQPFYSLFNLVREEADQDERTLSLVLSTRKTFSELEIRAASCDQEIWWALSGRPQHSPTGEFAGYRGNGVDITSSRQNQRDASRLAMYDALTGLANRHRMLNLLTSVLAAYKAAKRVCAVIMIDLDRFKKVNDTLGHPAGDELLKQVAERLGRVAEKGWEIGRLGADEFQIIVPDVDDRGQLGEIAKKIIAMISQPYSIDGSRCVIGASVGMAIAPYDGVCSDELIRSTDLALYAAKGGGRGQFRFYSNELHSEAERRSRIEEDLRDALSKEQIHMAYQPLVDSSTNMVVALEALMRWEHPELGSISPSAFIPIAEESGLIGALGSWALKQACQDAGQWPGNVKVSVNVSPVQFGNEQLPALVAQALSGSGLPAERLELELTESIFLHSGETTDQMFVALKRIGVRLALDDFGTGYSSLGYLKSAPFDKIKIDQGFIRGVTEPGSRNVAIIKAIVSLAEALGMDTTAEGIEAHDELDLMCELGINQIQGFIYGKATRAEDVLVAMGNGEWVIEPHGPSKFRSDRRTVLRKVGVIHEDHRYEVMLRNQSCTGCLIEGLLDVPADTQFVVDFGEGQLAVATVKRSSGSQQGLEFEVPLVDDGAGGLVTRNRISPYVLAAAGMPLAALPSGSQSLVPSMMGGAAMPGSFSMPRFGQVNDSARRALRAG